MVVVEVDVVEVDVVGTTVVVVVGLAVVVVVGNKGDPSGQPICLKMAMTASLRRILVGRP
jgi:hypothetical protein